MTTKTTGIISYVLLGVASLMVAMSGIMKVSGAQELVTKMTQAGFGPYIFLFGLIELVAVVLLFIKKTYKVGFLLLCCYLGGALAVELGSAQFPTAAVLLILLWIGSYLRDKSHFKTSVAV
jgi:hypothetical protein